MYYAPKERGITRKKTKNENPKTESKTPRNIKDHPLKLAGDLLY